MDEAYETSVFVGSSSKFRQLQTFNLQEFLQKIDL